LDIDARYYDPVIGRFYSNDPASFSNIHNFNRYTYANNNPYKYIDPDGRNSYNPQGMASTLQGMSTADKLAGVKIYAKFSPAGRGAQLVKAILGIVLNGAASPDIDPSDIAGKSPDEIEEAALDKGLKAKGPDPKSGQGSYVDPVTGKQRVLVHPNADCGAHCHVNDSDGNRLDEDGNIVPPESPEAHLPIKETN